MKLFITGTESFVAKELIKHCRLKKFDIYGCDYTQPSDPAFHKADIRSKDIIDIIPKDVDAIIHLAALSRDADCKNNAYDCFDVNVMGTLNLMDAAEKNNAKQFIFASSEWAYGSFEENEIKDEDTIINIADITSEYALSKIVTEANLRQKFQHGFCDTTILRFGIIYGSRKENWSAVESIFNSVKTKDELTVGSLKTARRFIHVSDIASGIIESLGQKGLNIINLQADSLVTLGDIINTSKKTLNKSLKITEANPKNANIRNVSNKRAKDLLKWQPKIDLKAGLNDLNKYLYASYD